MFATRMPPDAIFSHASAARLLSIPIPLYLEISENVDIASHAPHRAPHATGVRGHKLVLRPDDIVTTYGLRHTSPARTWFDLASDLTLLQLVAAGDFIVQRRLPSASSVDLARIVGRNVGKRGAVSARQSLPLLSDRAESPPESMLRVILELGGLPKPRINHSLVDTEEGQTLRPDFTFDEQMAILEYQGDYHRTKSQWRKDMTRRSRLETLGWRVMELNWDDLADPHELVRRVRTLLLRRR
ncbi:MAG: hypothetical protein JWN80_2724 [Microbacteriaceae bacterium]|nr:hypothetical protein [Microbacteriaceae bacterium]